MSDELRVAVIVSLYKSKGETAATTGVSYFFPSLVKYFPQFSWKGSYQSQLKTASRKVNAVSEQIEVQQI